MQFYEMANDYYSLVRILCFNGQMARAAEITEESGSKAAAYHLARRLTAESAVSCKTSSQKVQSVFECLDCGMEPGLTPWGLHKLS